MKILKMKIAITHEKMGIYTCNFNRMVIDICTTDLIRKTSPGLYDGLSMASEPRASLGDLIPG